LLALPLQACGGDDDDDGPGSGATPPAGWKTFDEEHYSGIVRDEWNVTYIDFEDAAQGVEQADLPEGLKETIRQAGASGQYDNVLFIVLEQDGDFASNINILPCGDSSNTPGDAEDAIDAFEAVGVDATKAGEAEVLGKTVTVVKPEIVPDVDTFQVVGHKGSCYSVITLTADDSVADPLEDFRTFLAQLDIEPD
ncbi:MAG: hypothetical protein ACM3S1_15740, partial [Hyphomicrobiales bacterium]